MEITPLINGVEYAWGDITVSLGGSPLTGITAVSYKEEQEVTNNYGAGRYPVSRSRGRVTAEASITLLMSELQAVIAAAPNGRLQDYAPFDVVVSYVPENNGTPVTHVIKDCQFKSTDVSWSEGDTSAAIELPLVCSHIKWR